MSNERPPPRTSQAFSSCDELDIAQQQCADAKNKRNLDPLFWSSIVGAGFCGASAFTTIVATGLFAATPIATVIGVLAGALFVMGCGASGIAGGMRMKKLDDALDGARARVTDIKNAMLDGDQHSMKTVAEATASAPPPSAVLDVTIRLSVPQAPPVPADPPAASVAPPVPAANAQPFRPAAASQTQGEPVPT